MSHKIRAFFAGFHSAAFTFWTVCCATFFAGYACNALLDGSVSEVPHLLDVLFGTISVWFVYPTLAALVRWSFTGKFSLWP